MPKQNLKASLVRYARVEGKGWRRGSIITSRNGRVKNDFMRIGGREYSIDPASPYQVRYYEGSKACYVTVGPDYEAAQAMLAKHVASRQLEAAHETLGIVRAEPEKPTGAPRTIAELVEDYIAKKKSPSLNLSRTSIRHYEDALHRFVQSCGRESVHDVIEKDILDYIDDLKREGYTPKPTKKNKSPKKRFYSQKTLAMRYTTVRGFLKSHGLDVNKIIEESTHRRLSMKPDEDTDPYTQEELDRLLAVCDDYHARVFSFLKASGLRYREANHLTWRNVDLVRNVINVPFKESVNRVHRDRKTGKMVPKTVEFETKSRRKREVPIFPSLRVMLVEWRQKHPDRVYLFGSRLSDMPDNHWLEYGKRAWRKAGLNCGTCGSCAKRKECEQFFLHKFRHTFAHCCLDGGIGIHKVSRWLGHHSIEVTAVYLRGRSTAADKDPFAATAA